MVVVASIETVVPDWTIVVPGITVVTVITVTTFGTPSSVTPSGNVMVLVGTATVLLGTVTAVLDCANVEDSFVVGATEPDKASALLLIATKLPAVLPPTVTVTVVVSQSVIVVVNNSVCVTTGKVVALKPSAPTVFARLGADVADVVV